MINYLVSIFFYFFKPETFNTYNLKVIYNINDKMVFFEKILLTI